MILPSGARHWLIEDKLIPRPLGARGPGTPTGFHPAGPGMKVTHARDGSLDDVEGRLKDLDKEAIDLQVVYPSTLLAVGFPHPEYWEALPPEQTHPRLLERLTEFGRKHA